MPKITYLSPYFWPETIGSAPYCTDVAKALHSVGNDVSVLAFRPHYPNVDNFLEWQDGSRDIETVDGLTVRRCPATVRGDGGFKTRLKNDLRFLMRAIRSAFSSESIETRVVVAYVPSMFAALGGTVIAKWRKAKFVIVVHDIESGLAQALGIVKNPAVLAAMKLFERIGLNRADEIIVLTEGMKSYLREIGCKRPIEVLPIWSNIFPEASARGDRFRIGYSGNFGKKQNLDQLLPLIETLNTQQPDIEVVLRGEGSEKDRLVRAVNEKGLTNVRFENLAPQDTFVASLQEIDLHLVPQALNVANYALPSKLVSIMAAGRPFLCIAEPHSPLNQIARDSGAGVCVEPGQNFEIIEIIKGLAKDAARRTAMGQAGRQYVDNNMKREVILNRYIQIAKP